MTDRALLDHIARLPHARANFKQLVRELGARGTEREDLETALARLTARGDLIELRSGHYAVIARSREFAVGRLQMHRDGYGFLIADRPVEGVQGDIFIPPESAEKAMHGDRIVVRIGRRGQYVVPHDDRIHQWIEIPDGMEFPPETPSLDRIGAKTVEVASIEELDGMVVNVELLEYPEKGAGPVGRV